MSDLPVPRQRVDVQPKVGVPVSAIRKVPLWLVVSGLNIVFAAHLFGRVPSLNPTSAPTYRYTVFGFLCIVGGGFWAWADIPGDHPLRSNGWRAWLLALLGVLAVMVVRSLSAGFSVVTVVFRAIPYLFPLLLSVGSQREYWPALNKVFVFHTLIAIAFALWAFPRAVYAGRSLGALAQMDVAYLSGMLYATRFLFLSLPRQSRWGKIAGVGGLLVLLLLAIFTAGRALLRDAAILLILGAVLWYGDRLRGRRMFWLGIPLVVLLLVSVPYSLLASTWAKQSGFDRALQELGGRFTTHGDVVETMIQDGRVFEAQAMLRRLTWDEWILGSGFSSTWLYDEIERVIVHVGYVHLIWRGGIFLLVLFLINPILVGCRTWLSGRALMVRAAAALAALYAVQLTTGGAPDLTLVFLMYWFAAGMCIGEGRSG